MIAMLTLFILTAGCRTTHASVATSPRQRFAQARNYYCYYASDEVEKLSRYDVVILHTPQMTPQHVRRLKSLGVVTIGYITVGEDDALRVGNGKGPGGKASWYFDQDHDNLADENKDWHSFYANANDPEWRKDRIAEARKLADQWGFDGFFLDTIETPDHYPQSTPGMIRLVEELRNAFPNKVIVANRAFHLLGDPRVGGNIDGIMFEDFSTAYNFAHKRYVRYTPQQMDGAKNDFERYVRPAMTRYPSFRVLALDYCDESEHDWIQTIFDRDVTFGMLPCVSSIDLNHVYDTHGMVGHADGKWLREQATPQAMSIRLESPRNGFPAGTIVTPSSCFMGYSVAPVVDGIRERSKLSWNQLSWASKEDESAKHTLTFTLSETLYSGRLKIVFASDEKAVYASRKLRIEIKENAQTPGWAPVFEGSANGNRVIEVPLPDNQDFRLIRLVQEPNGGSAPRPGVMWIEQVELIR